MARGDWLYLFSSNASPQYAQDVLNVFAGVPGQHYVFRYEERRLDDPARRDWRSLPDDESWILVCFSLQQQSFFQDAAFIPIRLGRVVSTEKIGSHYFVTFSLGRYVSLPEPAGEGGEDYAAKVREFSAYLRTICTTPYDASASLGKPLHFAGYPRSLDVGSSQPVLFEQTTRYLIRTESFREARFLRFEALLPRGGSDQLTLTGARPAFTLEAGKNYDLRLMQTQPFLVSDRRRFNVSVDGTALSLVGEAGFDISSSYDQIPVEIRTHVPRQFGTYEGFILIEPQMPGCGPRLEVPCRVVSSAKHAAAVALLTALALVLIALPTAIHVPLPWNIVIAAAGATAAAYLQVYGFAVPTPPTPPTI